MNLSHRIPGVPLALTLFVLVALHAAGSPLPPLQETVNRMEVPAGWAVHVGSHDGQVEKTLAGFDHFIITGLAYSEEAEKTARSALQEARLNGRATIHRVLDTHRLPMSERSVALLIIPNDQNVTQTEVQRVLRPGGIALHEQADGSWEQVLGAWPDGMDDWTHFNYGPGANDHSSDTLVGPMKSLRWLADDVVQNDVIGMRFSQGVLVSIENNTSGHSTQPPNGVLTARDAFSGAILWERPGFLVRSRYSLVLDDRRVYVHALDARSFKKAASFKEDFDANEQPLRSFDLFTGEDALVFDQGLRGRTAPTRDRKAPVSTRANLMTVKLVGDKLVQRLNGQLADLHNHRGQQRRGPGAGDLTLGKTVVTDGTVISLAGPGFSRGKMGYLGWTPIFNASMVVAHDLATGKELWKVDSEALSRDPHVIRLCAAEGAVGIVSYSKYHNTQLKYMVTCFDLKTGAQRWTQPGNKSITAGGHYPRVKIRDGRLWATGGNGFASGLAPALCSGFEVEAGHSILELGVVIFRI